MRKFVVTAAMASLLSCSAAFGFWPEATDSSLEVGVGYRQDRLEWKTSSNFEDSSGDINGFGYYGNPARLKSHVKWRNLNIWQIEARGKYITCDNIYLRANGDYGWITSGKNKDHDYASFCDDYYFENSIEFAKSHSKAKGHVYDARLAVGYQFKLCDDSFSIAPLIGYSWHGQHIKDKHLHQNFYFDEEPLFVGGGCGSSSDFYDYSSCHKNHSTYHTRWNGPFIGFDFDYRFGCGCQQDWELFGTYEFHWAEFHGRGRWHQRRDLCNGFRHHAKNAYGSIFDIGVKWDMCDCWTIALRGEFQWFWADKGRDRAKICHASLGNVKENCTLSIPLRDVKWQSAAIMVDLGMNF